MILGIQLTSTSSLLELLRSTKKNVKDDLDKSIPEILESQLVSSAQVSEENATKKMLSEVNSSSSNMMSSNFVSSSFSSETRESTMSVLSAKKRMATQNAQV